MKKIIVLAFSISIIPSLAMAQSALSQLQQVAGPDALSAASPIQPVAGTPVVAPSHRLGIPLERQDVLASCQGLQDSQVLDLSAAAGTIQNCLAQFYGQQDQNGKNQIAIKAQAARLEIPACPPGNGQFACQAMISVQGIAITLSGQILMGNPIIVDLNYSVQKRGGKLLGYSASVINKTKLAQ